MASAASRADVNASYMPSPESGSTSPAASPTRTHVVAGRSRGADAAHRQPVAADLGECVGVDPVGARESREMVAQVRAFPVPAADTEVRVLALREQPAVAAVRLAELDHGRRGVALAVEVLPADVALERDAAHDAVLEPDRLRDDAVCPVRADERVRDDVHLPHLSP